MSEGHNSNEDKPPDEKTHVRKAPPSNYYYDDSTGYEIYDPEEDDGDENPVERGGGLK